MSIISSVPSESGSAVFKKHPFSRFLSAINVTFLFAASIIIFSAIAAQSRADTLADYLVQEVCDNGSGGHTSADPTSCPSTARKLNIGESLPYHKWDVSSGGGQISDSYPIAEISGKLRVVQTEYFDNTSSFLDPTFHAGDPVNQPSAYDLLLDDGTYVSAAGTYDQGAGWQPMWQNSSCSLSDSWVFGSKSTTVPFSAADTVATLNISSPQCPPNSNFGSAYTVWNYYANLPYESGKNLNTIKSWHFGGSSINASSIEVFYFTKEYGKTRWEAWSSTATGPNAGAVAVCPTGTTSGTVVFGTTTYYLQDCHDWSRVIASATGDWAPAINWHVDPIYYSNNLLTNTHMQCTNGSGVSGTCGATYSCQTISPWNRLGDLNWGYDPNVQSPTDSSNCALEFNIPDGPSGQGVYQDVTTIPSGHTNYSFGTALWLPGGGSSSASIYVFEVNGGGIVATHNVSASVTGTRQYFQGSFALNSATTWLRFQIYPGTVNSTYEFTDSWISPTP